MVRQTPVGRHLQLPSVSTAPAPMAEQESTAAVLSAGLRRYGGRASSRLYELHGPCANPGIAAIAPLQKQNEFQTRRARRRKKMRWKDRRPRQEQRHTRYRPPPG